MARNAKRILAGAVTSVLLTLGAAGTATADTSTVKGPIGCFGPPGQTIVRGDKMAPKQFQYPPGNEVSYCAQLANPGNDHRGVS